MTNLKINDVLVGDRADNVQMLIGADGIPAYANAVTVNGVIVWSRDNSPTSPPEPPTTLAASDGTILDAINIDWTHSSSSSVKYNLYRNGTFLVAITAHSYLDSNVTPETVYTYYVKSEYTDYPELGESISSNEDTGYSELSEIPGQIHNVNASDGTYTNKVNIVWDEIGDTLNYEIARDAQTQIIASPTASGYDDNTMVIGTQHPYWVRAVNADGAGPWSAYDYGHAGSLIGDAPVQITDLDASDNGVGFITVTWTPQDRTTSVDLYMDGGLVEANATSPHTITIAPSTHTFYVYSKNTNGSQPTKSLEDEGTSLEEPSPGLIVDFSATDYTILGFVACTWTNSANTDDYEIWREGTYGTENWTRVKDHAVSGNQIAADPAVVQRYKVRAVNNHTYTDSNIDDGSAKQTAGDVTIDLDDFDYNGSGRNTCTTSGNGDWLFTPPAGITSVTVCIVGGGGSGGNGFTSGSAAGGSGGGGGSGGVTGTFAVTPGIATAVFIALGGAAQTLNGGNGFAGGNSTAFSLTSIGGQGGTAWPSDPTGYGQGGPGGSGGGAGGAGSPSFGNSIPGEDFSGCGGSYSGGAGVGFHSCGDCGVGGGGGASGFGTGGSGSAGLFVGTVPGPGAGSGGSGEYLYGPYAGGNGRCVISWT